MSENDTTPGQALTPQPPPRPVKVYTPVENAMGIMDTARFEHLGRVATVLARAGLLPLSITQDKDGNWLDFETVQARAFLIANQADLFHCDPNALAQCTSFVHGKLMYEGKLVHGIIAARLGVDLLYEFGRYDAQTRDIKGKLEFGADGERLWTGEMPGPEDQGLGVRVLGTLPGEKLPRTVSGSVAMWHKGSKSPWANPNAWPRQLRYMGAREWCRAHKPSLLLGIITDDEMDDYRMALEAGVAAPALAPPVHGGFEERGRAQLLAAPSTDEAQESVQRKRAARRKAAEETAPPLTETRAADQQGCEHEWKSEGTVHTCKKCGLIDDAGEAAPPRPTETGSAQAAEPEPDTSETATPAWEDGQPEEGGSGPSPQPEEPTQEGEGQADTHDVEAVEQGHAARGETYLMEGDQPNAEGRRLTYRDGVRFSTTKGGAEFKVYAEHAPEVVVDAEAQDEEEGEVFGSDLPQEVRQRVEAYMQAVESFGPAGVVTEDVNGVPTKREPFDRVKLELQALRADGTWAALGGDAYQNEVRRDTWHIMADTFFPGDLPDYRTSPSAWRLWVEAQDDPEAVEESIGLLEDSEAFKKMDNAMKEQLRAAGYARINAISEGE